jgi:superfamily I DNA/RNA helicase
MYKVVQTKALNKCFRKLLKHGKKGKDATVKVRAAQSEAATEGAITSINRTKNGETRLDNVEKYDLGGGYRLVVQLVEENLKTRAFLFAGDHDDTQEWLDNHKDYKWIKNNKDQSLDYVQISEKDPEKTKIVNPEVDSAESLRELPLLRHLKITDWELLNLTEDLKIYALSINSESWECDPNGILEHIESISDIDSAILFDDLFTHSHQSELKELSNRVLFEIGVASVTEGEDLASIIDQPQNSEIFVTWDEVNKLPENATWADWLLFLHPEQKEIAIKDFKGPARLRGVSGSGKTCVMLHRARYLAKKYKKPILLVTLTESMRKLLDSLIKELCGVEGSLIETSTIQSLAQTITKELHPKGESAYRQLNSGDLIHEIDSKVMSFVKNHENFKAARLGKLDHQELKKFVEEEVYFIRSRLQYSEFNEYLDVKSFKRHGRKIRLSAEGRNVFLDAAKYKASQLKEIFKIDYEGTVAAANSLIKGCKESLESFGWASVDLEKLESKRANYAPYRCVLVDEVQDLSQLEVSMIGGLRESFENTISSINDGLFLVGDGAQTIYNKGFVLKNCGVNVSNRSFVLKKNYRNSKEIMSASYALIEKYEFADVDEDNIAKPTKPDFPTKVSEKPFVIKCKNIEDEIDFACNKVNELITEFQDIEGTELYPEICVIGLNRRVRDGIAKKLKHDSIKSNELKQTVSIDYTDSVAISTIESAKGHEFQHVFIVGVVEGVMPHKYSQDYDIARDASRLYVAMTRAQESLFISYNKERDNNASRFLIDIQEHCNEFDWKDKQLEMLA